MHYRASGAVDNESVDAFYASDIGPERQYAASYGALPTPCLWLGRVGIRRLWNWEQGVVCPVEQEGINDIEQSKRDVHL